MYLDHQATAICVLAVGQFGRQQGADKAYCVRFKNQPVMMQTSDPLDVIACEPPSFSAAEAERLAADHYGLDATATTLVSERDQNFRLDTDDRRRFVLKITNVVEDALVTDFQIAALRYIEKYRERHTFPLSVPQIVPSLDGRLRITTTAANGAEHSVRLVTWVAGVPLGDDEVTVPLARCMGESLAHLGRSLSGFRHAGGDQSLLWDLQQALKLRSLLEHIPDAAVRADVERGLDEFEEAAYPVLPSLRRQVIHSDFNPDNVMLDVESPDKVAGVIDFGDMLESPLIADVAIGASYMRPREGNPLALIVEFIAAYHGVTPLAMQELDVLVPLIKARLAASVSILYWRVAARAADDPYLGKLLESESGAAKFLRRLHEYPAASAKQTLRQVRASVTPAD